MKKRLQDLLVVSDLDGTLLTAPDGLPGCNETVIRLFTMLGGRFTIASGRSPLSVKNALGDLPLSAPAIVFNGGMIYDYQKEEPSCEHFVPRQTALSAIHLLREQDPAIGVEILASNGRMYQPFCGEYVNRHTQHEGLPYVVAPLEDIPGDWYKVLFGGSPEEIARLEKFAAEQQWEHGYFVTTGPVYLELLPTGVSKGAALRELCQQLKVEREDLYVIGDYFNDLSMMEISGHPIAVENAVPQVKLASEMTVLPCKDGGVAQLLYELIRRYGE